MAQSSRYPCEMHKRAVALVFETKSEYGLQWEAIVSFAEKVGVSVESLRRWVPQAEIDAGAWAGRRLLMLRRFVSCGRRMLSEAGRSGSTT